MQVKVFVFLLLTLVYSSCGQNAGTTTPEEPPPITISTCDEQGCQEENAFIVLDVDYRPFYSLVDGSTPCQTSGGWDQDLCPDPVTCAQNCAVDGFSIADYENYFGVSTSGSSLHLNYLTESSEYGTVIGSRTYLLDANNEYRMFFLKNREFTFDVDNIALECGMNGALYFVEMEKDGGMASYPTNTAGAKYGTGYCDAQCFHYMKFIGGQVNLDGEPDVGACCVEMDMWEGNAAAQMYTTHGCNVDGYFLCQRPDECGDIDRYNGVCDKDGGAFNPFRLNAREFYGNSSSFEVDSSKPVTVVTQFLTDDGTDAGTLSEIRRLYVQNGVVISNAMVGYPEIGGYDSISDDYVSSYKRFFGEINDVEAKGGLSNLGASFDRGVVLAFSMWDDAGSQMLWMDGVYPPGNDPNNPGAMNGPCPADSGIPDEMHQLFPEAYVTFSNIKIGTVGSTYTG